MSMAVNLSNELVCEARIVSKVEHRSLSKQIEHWAMLGKQLEENPDLTGIMIREILLAMEQMDEGKGEVYKFGDKD